MYVCVYVGDGGCAWVPACVAAGGPPYDDVEPGHGRDRAEQQNDAASPACRHHVWHNPSLMHMSALHDVLYVLGITCVCMYVFMFVCM